MTVGVIVFDCFFSGTSSPGLSWKGKNGCCTMVVAETVHKFDFNKT